MSQAKRLLAQLGALAAVAAALGLYAYFGVHEPEKKAAAKKEEDLRLMAFERRPGHIPDGGVPKGSLIKLTVTAKKQKTVLEKTLLGDWIITSPIKTRADKLMVDGLISQLQTARFKLAIDEDPTPENLTAFGLDKPSFVVEAEVEYGVSTDRQTYKVEGGAENSFDGTVYMRRGDEKTVYMAPGGVRFAAQRATTELRDQLVLAVPEDRVTGIQVKTTNNEYRLVRAEDKTWQLDAPTAAQADTTQVLAMLSSLRGERAQDFKDDNPSARAVYGVANPAVDAVFLTETGERIHLAVARAPEDGGTSLFALREDAVGTALAKMNPSAVGLLDRNPRDFLDKRVLPIKKELVSRVVFHPAQGPEVVVEKPSVDAGAEAWRVAAPEAGPARVFKITAALWQLTSLAGGTIVDEKPKDLAKYGLDGKTARFVSLGTEAGELGRLVIGKEVPGKPNFSFALNAKGAVVELEASRLGELPWTLADVKDTPKPAADAGH